jgi:CheY-like chemotaxis protein
MVVTVLGDEEQVLACIEAGATGYLTGPSPPSASCQNGVGRQTDMLRTDRTPTVNDPVVGSRFI